MPKSVKDMLSDYSGDLEKLKKHEAGNKVLNAIVKVVIDQAKNPDVWQTVLSGVASAKDAGTAMKGHGYLNNQELTDS